MTRRFGRNAGEIAVARRLVRTSLDSWGLGAQAAALELAVSELVSNAVLHGAGAIDVELRSGDGQIRLEVTDEGHAAIPPRPVEAPAFADEPGGWGLRLVDQVADRWGTSSDPGHTRVWVIKRTGEEGPHAGERRLPASRVDRPPTPGSAGGGRSVDAGGVGEDRGGEWAEDGPVEGMAHARDGHQPGAADGLGDVRGVRWRGRSGPPGPR